MESILIYQYVLCLQYFWQIYKASKDKFCSLSMAKHMYWEYYTITINTYCFMMFQNFCNQNDNSFGGLKSLTETMTFN